MVFETLNVCAERAVLFVEIVAPPLNLEGPELVRARAAHRGPAGRELARLVRRLHGGRAGRHGIASMNK